MASLLSPGVQVNEIDISVVASNDGSTNAAFGGNFEKGYSGKAININSVAELVSNFGKPNNENFNQWFQCYYYLQYSNGLYVSRAVDENGHWNSTENTVKTLDIGKIEINGNPTNIFAGSIVKFGKDSEVEYKVKSIETPIEAKTFKGELEITNAQNTTDYKVKINNQDFTFRSTDAVAENIATGLSNVIDISGVLIDKVEGNKIILEAVNPGQDILVEIITNDKISFTKTQEPRSAVNCKLVFDNETDFNGKVNVSDPIFVKGFSVNAFKFVPVEKSSSDLEPEKPYALVNATDQIAYEELYQNEDEYDVKEGSINFPENSNLKIIARTFGKYGNNIKIAIAKEADFDNPESVSFQGIPLKTQFEYKPLNSKREIAVLVMENGVIVEKFIGSLNPDAKDYQGRSTFIEEIFRRKSRYIYVKVNTASTRLPNSYLGNNCFNLTNGQDGEIGKSEIENSYGNVSDGVIFGDVESLPLDYIISNEEARTIAGKLATARGDCIAFHGSKYQIVGQNSTKIVEQILDDVNNGEMNGGDVRNSYNCYFGNYALIWDSYNDKHRWINIAGMCAGVRAKTSFDLYPWYASAGESQGQLVGVTKLAFLPNTGARDKLYVSQVNPVTSFPGRGMVIFGQKTLQAENSAFSRINVRLLFNYIKRNLSQLLRAYVFELNDEFTRNSIKAQIDSFLQRVQTLRGVYEFLSVCDETNNTAQVIDNNQLVIDVAIRPSRVAEFIYLNLYATGSDVSLSELFNG